MVTDAEVLTLQSILEAEDSHAKQWKKHLLAVLAVAANLLVNWLRGDASPLEITKCGYQSWAIFGLFCIFMLALSFYGVRINQKEQALKRKVGRGLVNSDIRFNGRQLY